MKKCNKCLETKPLNNLFFGNMKRSKDGFNWICKQCQKADSKKRYPTIKDRMKKQAVEYNRKQGNKYTHKFESKWGAGVYGIFENGKCLYVGESSKLARRIQYHKQNITHLHPKAKPQNLYKNIQNHSNWVVGILEQTDNHKELEEYYINKLNPIYNGIQ